MDVKHHVYLPGGRTSSTNSLAEKGLKQGRKNSSSSFSFKREIRCVPNNLIDLIHWSFYVLVWHVLVSGNLGFARY